MKEIKTIIEKYHQIDFNQHRAALVTVVRVEGSSYRRTGARMLVTDNGEWTGGISGGCLEGDALRKARLSMAQNKPALVTYDTSQDDPFQVGVGLGCNGIIDVLIKPLDANAANNPVTILQNNAPDRQSAVVLTLTALSQAHPLLQLGDVFRYDSDQQFGVHFPIEALEDGLLGEIKDVLLTKKSNVFVSIHAGATLTFFLELLPPPIHLAIYGGGYDVYPLVRLAKELGWEVSVVCNVVRARQALFEVADRVLDKQTDHARIDAYTAVVLMSHDYESDFENMERFLQTPLSYLGMLGPRKRTQKMFDRMASENRPISDENLARISSPIGLDIGATTPEEIALSVLAEIRAHFAQRGGSRLKDRQKPINED